MMATNSANVNDNLCPDHKRNRLPETRLCPAAIAMQQAEKQRQLEALRRMIETMEGRQHDRR